MDKRDTLQNGERFSELLKVGLQSGEKISMLVDDQGISRVSGFIKSIQGAGNASQVELEEGLLIPIDKIVAINGIFRSDYSEC